MNITKLNIIICFLLTTLTASAMKYQIKVLNTPTITIDNREAKVGDWFDDQSVIIWSRDNQAMRVVSEDNKVYTLSAKLYKESNSKKFSDFIIYTKPLAARGTNNPDLIAKLQERFDQDFIMLDEIIIDLSGIDLPEDCHFEFAFIDGKSSFIINPSDGIVRILRSNLEIADFKESDHSIINLKIRYMEENSVLVYDSFQISVLPLN